MTVLIVTLWCLTGILTVPWIIGEINRRGDSMDREPAVEVFVGAIFGPVPIAMFIVALILGRLGRIVHRITGQSSVRR